MAFLESLFGGNKQVVSRLQKDVDKINALEEKFKAFSDEQMKTEVQKWRSELRDLNYEEQQAKLNELLHEAFALTREAARRTIGQRHFDVQLMGGITLHRGQIAEMKTGEGKTLTATLPLVLNALAGQGAHLVTVNDYLARWHASLMGPIYHALGLSVSSIQHEKSFLYDPSFEPEQSEIDAIEAGTQGLVLDVKHMRPINRRQAYAADITYGTNNEFGFDYLRDNMVSDINQMVQREEPYYSIVDEVDSILIDEARTPLIISAPDTDPTDKYYQFAKLVEKLTEEADYLVDEKKKAATLTDEGISKLEKLLNIKNIYEGSGITTVHHLEQALRARTLFKRDRNYVVRDGEVIIVDEFTGRLMFGRRYSDGLHQAIEAKEGVKIQQESKTLATITFQNLFRMYKKLAGMTGTALTEAEEFFKIYKLEVVEIPTHRPMIRADAPDSVYKSEKGKFEAITRDIQERHKRGQPILIGTVSIQKNELLAEHLKQAGLQFEILNAKNHEREANIIAQAGRFGAITVATNIAGRGVDILLGGNPVDPEEAKKVREAGGLHIIGTERHESRRIDNQLRGRAGRQGDPGSSQFFVSVEDDLMRLFGGDRLKGLMEKLGIPEDQPIEHSLVSRSIESAQKKIEGLNFDTRKHVLEYDDVMNKQRQVVYGKRKAWLKEPNYKEEILTYIDREIEKDVRSYFADEEAADIKKLVESLGTIFPMQSQETARITELEGQAGDAEFAIIDYAKELARTRYEEREKGIDQQSQNNMSSSAAGQPQSLMRQLERLVCLQCLDTIWMQHLDNMEHLRDSVGLRGYGQRDPLVEYKREGYELFQRALDQIENDIARTVYKVGVTVQPQPTPIQAAARNAVETGGGMDSSFGNSGGAPRGQSSAADTDPAFADIGRNDPCPCGSGKKFKKCGLLNTSEHQQLMASK